MVRPHKAVRGLIQAALVCVAGNSPLCGQCTPQWRGYSGPILSHSVYAAITWDPDGGGAAPAVVVAGGNFEHAGSTTLNFVGLWDGSAWRSMAGGVDGGVRSAALYDPDG